MEAGPFFWETMRECGSERESGEVRKTDKANLCRAGITDKIGKHGNREKHNKTTATVVREVLRELFDFESKNHDTKNDCEQWAEACQQSENQHRVRLLLGVC